MRAASYRRLGAALTGCLTPTAVLGVSVVSRGHSPPESVLLFDDFDGRVDSAPNTAAWRYAHGDGGWGNDEARVYPAQPANVRLDGHGHSVVEEHSTPTVHTFRRPDLASDAMWVFDKPPFLLLNVAVGGRWPGPAGPDTAFPVTMVTDWIEVTDA